MSGDLPWDEYVAALRPQGELCISKIPNKPVAFGALGLIGGEKSIVGGETGLVSDRAEMLAFTARHGIKPIPPQEPFIPAPLIRAIRTAWDNAGPAQGAGSRPGCALSPEASASLCP